MEPRPHDVLTSFGLLLLRLGVGVFMAAHGWGKVQMIMEGKPFPADPIGLGPQLSLYMVTAAEFGCAILVILGLFTRLAAVPVAFAMGVAAFVAHANDPWFNTGMGAAKEGALMFMIPFLALVFTGPGQFSLDHLLWSRWRASRQPQVPR
jgi:putative oxidoreductase